MADEATLEDVERHKEFLLTALRAAALRARTMEADINTIGVALKGDLIGPDTAVRWIMEAGLLPIVGAIPEATTKIAATHRNADEKPRVQA